MAFQEKNLNMETKRHLKNILLHNNKSYYQKKQDISSSSNDSLLLFHKKHSNSFTLQKSEQQLAENILDSRDQDKSLNKLSLNDLLLKHKFINIKHLRVSQQSYQDAIDSFQNYRISKDKQRKRNSFNKQQAQQKAKIKKNIIKTNIHQNAFNLKYQKPIPVNQQHFKRCQDFNNQICQESLIKKTQLRSSDSEWNKQLSSILINRQNSQNFRKSSQDQKSNDRQKTQLRSCDSKWNKQLSSILINRQNSQKYIELNDQTSFQKSSQNQKSNDRQQTEKKHSKINESKQKENEKLKEIEKENFLYDQLTTFRKHVKIKSSSRLKNYQNINPYKNYIQWKQNERKRKQKNLQSIINKLLKEKQQQSGLQNQLIQSVQNKNQSKSIINQLPLEIKQQLKLDLTKTQQNMQTKQQQKIQSEILKKDLGNRIETSLKHDRRRRRIFQKNQNLSRSKISNQQKKYNYQVSNKYRKQSEVNCNQIEDKIVKFGPIIKYRQLECFNQFRNKNTNMRPTLQLQKDNIISKYNIKLQNYIQKYGYG